uniref:BACK domain-containing protein n=1 Tax=Glossina morsitans morsitans TaxID=37546 RepID=A0A1B0GE95_GLOMM
MTFRGGHVMVLSSEILLHRLYIKDLREMVEALKESFASKESNWIKEPVQAAASFEDGLYVQSVLQAIRKSSETKSWQTVQINSDSPSNHHQIMYFARTSTIMTCCVVCGNVYAKRGRMMEHRQRQRSVGGLAAVNGCVYALGGHDGLSVFDSVERYDPVNDVWHKMKSMLNCRCRLGAAALNGKLYACGGYDGNPFLRSVEAYDPIRNCWSVVTPMNGKRSRVDLAANMLCNNNAYTPSLLNDF